MNFSKSKRAYIKIQKGVNKTYYRYFNLSYLQVTLKNGEKLKRDFLMYSESKGVIFCCPCLLFGNKSAFATTGFSNWQKAEERILEHTNSSNHRSNIIKMKDRGNTLGRIDNNVVRQIETQRTYWVNVLKRVVAVVKRLSSRGLAFRGATSKIGCNNNGNFLMALELLAEFDPFLSNHLETYGNPGKGNTSYISYNVYEQFISIMSRQVLNTIIQEVKASRYFSISVDSTPDISHFDQLSFCVRYVNNKGEPVERFLCFLDQIGHKAEDMANAVFSVFKKYDLNIEYLRGQSYDNASNMSGIYAGLQAKIKEVNPLAKFVPCSAHSLNLVGTNAVDCCTQAVLFFDLLQNVYTFFTASTHRWKILNTSIKGLSETRWSARDDACQSLNKNWSLIINALNLIINDDTEKTLTRNEAKGIINKLNNLETAFLSIFWGQILHRFNITNKKLQSVNIDLGVVCELYKSLITYIIDLRSDENYDYFKQCAIEKSKIKQFQSSTKRSKIRKQFFDEGPSKETTVEYSHFKVNTYFVILDQLRSQLEKRNEKYENLLINYNFFFKLTEMTSIQVRKNAEVLRNEYKDDLSTLFANECVHFRSHLLSIGDKVSKTIQDMCSFLRKNDLICMYPYIDVSLRMLLCTPVSNCSTGRSFSCLKRVKTYLRSCTTEERLNYLAIMNIESDITANIEFDDVIHEFATLQSRRKI